MPDNLVEWDEDWRGRVRAGKPTQKLLETQTGQTFLSENMWQEFVIFVICCVTATCRRCHFSTKTWELVQHIIFKNLTLRGTCLPVSISKFKNISQKNSWNFVTVDSRTEQQGSECGVGSSQWACFTEIIPIYNYILPAAATLCRLAHQTCALCRKIWDLHGSIVVSMEFFVVTLYLKGWCCNAMGSNCMNWWDYSWSINQPSRPPDGATMVTLSDAREDVTRYSRWTNLVSPYCLASLVGCRNCREGQDIV